MGRPRRTRGRGDGGRVRPGRGHAGVGQPGPHGPTIVDLPTGAATIVTAGPLPVPVEAPEAAPVQVRPEDRIDLAPAAPAADGETAAETVTQSFRGRRLIPAVPQRQNGALN